MYKFLLFLFLSFLLLSCSDVVSTIMSGPQVEDKFYSLTYFRYQNFELNEKTIKKFYYEDNILSTSEILSSEDEVEYSCRYIYNDQKYPLFIEVYDLEDSIDRLIELEYSDNKLILRRENIKVSEEILTVDKIEKFDYDHLDRFVQHTVLNNSNELLYSKEIDYTTDGKIEEINIQSKDDQNNLQTTKYRSKYQHTKLDSLYHYQLENDEWIEKGNYSYMYDGLLDKIIFGHSEGKIKYKFSYYYDESNYTTKDVNVYSLDNLSNEWDEVERYTISKSNYNLTQILHKKLIDNSWVNIEEYYWGYDEFESETNSNDLNFLKNSIQFPSTVPPSFVKHGFSGFE